MGAAAMLNARYAVPLTIEQVAAWRFAERFWKLKKGHGNAW